MGSSSPGNPAFYTSDNIRHAGYVSKDIGTCWISYTEWITQKGKPTGHGSWRLGQFCLGRQKVQPRIIFPVLTAGSVDEVLAYPNMVEIEWSARYCFSVELLKLWTCFQRRERYRVLPQLYPSLQIKYETVRVEGSRRSLWRFLLHGSGTPPQIWGSRKSIVYLSCVFSSSIASSIRAPGTGAPTPHPRRPNLGGGFVVWSDSVLLSL